VPATNIGEYQDPAFGSGGASFASAMLRIGTTLLFLCIATGAGRLCRAMASLRRLSRGPFDRLNDCVVNGVSAMDAMRFSYRSERTAGGMMESPQAIRAGDRNVRLSSGIVPVSLNPEGCRVGLLVGRQPRRLCESSDDSQQGPDTTALLVEGIGGNSGRHLMAGKCAAHRDYPN